MGALADLGDIDEGSTLGGNGQRLIEWWQNTDDTDRALLRYWAEIVDPGRGRMRVPAVEIAERLTAAGCVISPGTTSAGIRRLRRTEWAH